MKRLIDFCLLLLMVFWGSNAWADKTMTFSATYPTSDCNLTKLNVPAGKSQSIENGGITLTITAASGVNASWNDKPGSKHEQTIGLMTNAKITISSSSAEMKITKIVFNFENNQNKGYFAESSTTGGTLAPTEATSYVTTQTWSSDQGANSVSLTNNSAGKAYIKSIDITYQTGGLDNTVQAYPYTWNFKDDKLWKNSENQFVSEIWTHSTNGVDEWRNTGHEPTVATGYDVDLLRGLRFTGHVCADRKGNWVSLPRTATITIPSLYKGQKVKISYTGVDILPTTNLKVSQKRKDNIEIYKVTQNGDAILTVDPTNTIDWGVLNWGAWISQISVLDAAPVLTMTTPANKEVDPNTLKSITVTSEKALWAYNVDGTKTPTTQTIKATLTSDDGADNMEVTATFTADETGVKELNFTLPQGKQLESATTYTLNIPENVIMETSGTGNENCSFTFSTKGLNYLGAYNGSKKIEANPETVSTLDNNRVEFAFEEKLEKTADFKVIVSDGTTVNTYTKDSKECVISTDNRLYVPVQLKAGKYYSIKITAGSLKDATAGSTLKNNQIVLHLISSLEGINLSMTTPYNQDEAPLTTRIILSANTLIKNSVEATLVGKSADGNQTHDIGIVEGIANGNKLVFTPKEGQQLRPNYTYTLHLKEKAELQNVVGGKFEDDTFVFTTAKVIGNAPIVESTSPAAESTIPVEDVQPTPNTPKKIKITFNEDIQLLDGALIFCRPMGGSESYQSLEYYSARSNNYNQYNKIHVEGNKLWFEYSDQNLFYGMRYEVTIPTYAIVGNGGQPMEKNIKFYFETPKSREASDSRDGKDVYTWDFTNISSTTFDKIRESVNEDKTYWGFDEKNHAYGSSKAPKNRPFAQGQEIKAGASNTFILPELKGLLFNLVKYNSNRFQIVCENGSEDKGNTYLYLNGGTHYVTIQSVPANAMVYIEHNGNEMFNLNTLGVDSLKTITNSNNNCVSVYRLGNTTKDLTFCVQNCKLYCIAIVKDNKTIGSTDKDYIKYATYSQSYPVDYSLNERLNGTAVTAYSVSTTYQSDATFVNFTELPNNQSASGEGVILKTSGKLGESHPIFTTDFNTTPQKLTSNALVGTTGDKATTEFEKAKKDGYQNYILTTGYFHLNKDDQVIDGNRQCFYKWVKGDTKSNFAYLQLKNPGNANAKTVIYLDWFGDTTGIHGMTAPSQVTSGKTYYTLDGRKVTSPTQKGIYIINGKKIIIK
ncbi:leucine rich repeat protein [Prevotella sp. CAG:604]|nr:leucine rich repeat protein [Prevotella sp. CAG:604]